MDEPVKEGEELVDVSVVPAESSYVLFLQVADYVVLTRLRRLSSRLPSLELEWCSLALCLIGCSTGSCFAMSVVETLTTRLF